MMKLAVVVGGSSGIGYAVCKLLSGEYKVINLSRREAAGIESIKTDVSSFNSVKEAFSYLVKNYGTPDAMVYCPGFVEPQGILEVTEDIWNETVATNLTGAFYCTQEFVKYTKNRKAKIIYISSTAGTRAQPGWCAYAASKAGLINFALTMSAELKEYSINVYCIAPGRCATPLRKKLAPNEDQNKIMKPEEVARFVKYLADDGSLLDGQVIIVKGETR